MSRKITLKLVLADKYDSQMCSSGRVRYRFTQQYKTLGNRNLKNYIFISNFLYGARELKYFVTDYLQAYRKKLRAD